ncbi:hypothetical protein LSTR_LSTR003179 [Laodelphax striatellus]|uniref:EFCAB10 C-terminal EF-hand domain-containing protein n=1 Tax=Laodelphax striatellus TaxID=195883 RepID=A0A482XTJ1_LAOST|nr:hypothetical protein LSTR_LSTR003179 [Laodelphax striatellus]
MSKQEFTKNDQFKIGFENAGSFIDCEVGDKVFLRGKELNKSQQEAYQFLKEKRVEEIINFLIEHLLVNTPRDPLNFLVDLLDKCINFRDNLKDPPLLFDRSHQESIYKAFDPGNRGFVTQPQYCEALKTVGLGDSSLLSSMSKNSIIFKNEFLNEIDRALINHLYTMLGGEREDINISKAVRGSLQYKGRHRVEKSDSASILLKNGMSKSSVHFFLAMKDGLHKSERISHSEFFEHISGKPPATTSKTSSDLPEIPSYHRNEQGLRLSSMDTSVKDSTPGGTDYYVNKQFMHHRSTEEIFSLKNLPLAEGNESNNSFPGFVKQETGELLSSYQQLQEGRRNFCSSEDSKLENTRKSSHSLKDMKVKVENDGQRFPSFQSSKEECLESDDIDHSM